MLHSLHFIFFFNPFSHNENLFLFSLGHGHSHGGHGHSHGGHGHSHGGHGHSHDGHKPALTPDDPYMDARNGIVTKATENEALVQSERASSATPTDDKEIFISKNADITIEVKNPKIGTCLCFLSFIVFTFCLVSHWIVWFMVQLDCMVHGSAGLYGSWFNWVVWFMVQW